MSEQKKYGLFEKLITVFVILVLGYGIYLQVSLDTYKKKAARRTKLEIVNAIEKKDSVRNAEYQAELNYLNGKFNRFSDSLKKHSLEVELAKKKLSKSHDKTSSAYDARNAILLHPDSLKRF